MNLRPTFSEFRRPTMPRGSLLVILLLAATVSPSAMADVHVLNKDKFGDAVLISGELRWNDAKKVRSLELGPKYVWLLDSPGGDVDAAMEIGRFIRATEGYVIVSVSSRCLSSCALLFIAGVMRTNVGEVGLHRPYFVGQPQSRDRIEKALPRMFSEIREYVDEMRVSQEFAEIMLNTPPEDMRTFRGAEIEGLVPAQDPIHEEIGTSNAARAYGLTTDQYRRRELEAEDCFRLDLDEGYMDCREAILWGLSVSVYKSRINLAYDSCINDTVKEQVASGVAGPDHPVLVEFLTCKSDAMAGK